MLKTRPVLIKASLGSGESTAASSNTSPVLISFAARRTVSGFIILAEPRWSPAPHFDGHVRRHLPGLGVKRHATESKHRRSRHGQSAKVHLATSPMWIVS